MHPTLSNDDQIVCSRIKDINSFLDGSLGVVITEDGAVVKKLYRNPDNNAIC